MRLRVQALGSCFCFTGFGVQGLGGGLGFRVWGSGFWGFGVLGFWGFGFGVWGTGRTSLGTLHLSGLM